MKSAFTHWANLEAARDDEEGLIISSIGYQLNRDLEPLYRPPVFDYARWKRDWVKNSSQLEQDHCA